MSAVYIISLSSLMSVFVATLYLEGHTLAHFFHNYNIVFDDHSLLPFPRGERSLEVDLDHGYCSWGESGLPPVYKQFPVFSIIFSKIINE